MTVLDHNLDHFGSISVRSSHMNVHIYICIYIYLYLYLYLYIYLFIHTHIYAYYTHIQWCAEFRWALQFHFNFSIATCSGRCTSPGLVGISCTLFGPRGLVNVECGTLLNYDYLINHDQQLNFNSQKPIWAEVVSIGNDSIMKFLGDTWTEQRRTKNERE